MPIKNVQLRTYKYIYTIYPPTCQICPWKMYVQKYTNIFILYNYQPAEYAHLHPYMPIYTQIYVYDISANLPNMPRSTRGISTFPNPGGSLGKSLSNGVKWTFFTALSSNNTAKEKEKYQIIANTWGSHQRRRRQHQGPQSFSNYWLFIQPARWER